MMIGNTTRNPQNETDHKTPSRLSVHAEGLQYHSSFEPHTTTENENFTAGRAGQAMTSTNTPDRSYDG